MATYAEVTYPSTIRVELDKDGRTVKREVHQRTDTMRDGVVILREDRRVDDLDATAFAAEITEQYAAAVAQIDALATDKAELTKQLETVTAEKDAAVTQKEAAEAKL